MENLKIKMRHPQHKGVAYAKNTEHASNMMNWFNCILDDDRYTVKGKQIVKKKAKKKEDEAN